jgi:hypothetical protein
MSLGLGAAWDPARTDAAGQATACVGLGPFLGGCFRVDAYTKQGFELGGHFFLAIGMLEWTQSR